MLISDPKPPITDQREQHVTEPDRVGDHVDEVVAHFDRVEILENLVVETVGEPIEQPAGRVGSLLSPVADEDATRSGLSHETSRLPTRGPP